MRDSRNHSLTLVVSEPDYAIACWANVYFMLWRKETTHAAMLDVQRTFTDFLDQRGSQVGLLTIIEPNASLPPSELREAIADFLAAQAGRIAASAVVFEGYGFRNAAVRGVITGLTVLAKPPYPHRVFNTVQDATNWMVESGRNGAVWSFGRDQLLLAIRRFRESV